MFMYVSVVYYNDELTVLTPSEVIYKEATTLSFQSRIIPPLLVHIEYMKTC